MSRGDRREKTLLDDVDRQDFLNTNYNAVLDSVSFGAQTADVSYGRSGEDSDVWALMAPTPGTPNQ